MNFKFNDAVGGRFSATSDAVVAGEQFTYAVKLSDFTDVSDIAVFPIKFSSVTFTPDAKVGDTGHIDVPYVNVVYTTGSGVGSIEADGDDGVIDSDDVEYYNLQGIKIAKPSNGLYIERRGTSAEKKVMK